MGVGHAPVFLGESRLECFLGPATLPIRRLQLGDPAREFFLQDLCGGGVFVGELMQARLAIKASHVVQRIHRDEKLHAIVR